MSSSLKRKESNGENDNKLPAAERRESASKKLRWAADVVENEGKTNNDKYHGIGKNSTITTTAATAAAIKVITKDKNKTPANSTTSGRPDLQETLTKIKAPLCSFCGRFPAAIRVKSSNNNIGSDNNNNNSKSKKSQLLCVLHYYTTSSVHTDSDYVSILDASLIEAQLKGTEQDGHTKNLLNVQELFAEAFVQLQQELQQESLSIVVDTATTSSSKKINPRKAAPEHDPLSILHDLAGRGSIKKRRLVPPPPSSNTTAATISGGGFLRHVPVPERLRKTQQQQAQIQAEQMARMNRIANNHNNNNNNNNKNHTGTSITNSSAAAMGARRTVTAAKQQDTSKRRQPSRKSIWNSVMDSSRGNTKNKKVATAKNTTNNNNTFHEMDLSAEGITCSCGSTNVSSAGNITSRNQDVRKGETWGVKDRSDDVILRYRCNQCGKTWHESE